MSRYLFLFLIGAFHLTAQAEPLSVAYFQGDERYKYEVELLQHVLDITADKYGPANAVNTSLSTYQVGIKALQTGSVQVAFLATDRRNEFNFQPIRVPLLQGMLGYRLLLIHKDNQPKFDAIKTIDDLKDQTVAGFGLHWEDLRILYHNRLPVIANSNYQELFTMLSNQQVDYLPRGLNEVYNELEFQHGLYPNIELAPHIAIYYPYVRYFFVNKNNTILAQRLTDGLAKAKADGSFKAIFDKHFASVINKSQSSQRHLIELSNPFLPDSVPEIEKSWWMPNVATNSAGIEQQEANQDPVIALAPVQ